MIVLAIDVGGTKVDLALMSAPRGPSAPLAEATFPSRDYPDLDTVVTRFLGPLGLTPDRVVIGVAGPVVGGRARLTNLGWRIDVSHLAAATGTSNVVLMNDLEAIASAVPHLAPGDTHTLHSVPPEAGGAMAVVAPGTGLGEAFLVWDGSRYRACPSEGGHADFAPRTDREVRLLRWLGATYGHVSYERVCSGMAIPALYRFAREDGAQAHEALAARIDEADDPTPLIVDAAVSKEPPCPACEAGLEIFVSVLAAEAANLGLKVLATGGIYLAGGLPRRILPLLRRESFLASFLDKGRFRALVARMPLHVIATPKAALLGAMWRGLETR